METGTDVAATRDPELIQSLEVLGVHHIGKVVEDLDREANLLRALGFEVEADARIDSEQRVRVRLARHGEFLLELIEPLDAESPVRDTPPGLNHICLRVPDLARAMARVQEQRLGFPLTEVTTSVFDARPVQFFATRNRDVYEVIEA